MFPLAIAALLSEEFKNGQHPLTETAHGVNLILRGGNQREMIMAVPGMWVQEAGSKRLPPPVTSYKGVIPV
jgi:hypothetical protein